MHRIAGPTIPPEERIAFRRLIGHPRFRAEYRLARGLTGCAAGGGRAPSQDGLDRPRPRREPDRVPVDLHNFMPAAAASPATMPDVFRDGELLAETMLAAWREFGHDMILLENGGACNAEACGVEAR